MTDTDRELLELAAKAAGVVFDPDDKSEFGLWLVIDHEPFEHTRRRWNPLADDGDALRLAVKLGLHVAQDPDNKMVAVFFTAPDEDTTSVELWEADPYAATRRAIVRAIVRAAAEIGRNMK